MEDQIWNEKIAKQNDINNLIDYVNGEKNFV